MIYFKCPDKSSQRSEIMGDSTRKNVYNIVQVDTLKKGPPLKAKVFGAKVFENLLAGSNYDRF